MDSVKELAKQIAGYIKGKKTRAYDTAAEVRRIVGNTAYVHIPGGVPETPVKLTIDAKVGDTVQVRVANSTAWLVGNSTAPPTDDTKAKEADANAGKAMTKAKKAEAIAEEGLKEAQGTSNYFWHVDGSGAESGAHVTEIPQAEFQANPSGGNLLMRSNGIQVRDGTTVLSSFGASSSTVGNSDGSHIVISPNSVGFMNDAYYMPAEINYYGDGSLDTAELLMKAIGAGGDASVDSKADTSGTDVTIEANQIYPSSVDVHGSTIVGGNTVAVNTSTFRVHGKTRTDALDNGIFVLETHQILASQAIAGGAHVYNEVTFTKAGYYPLCIAGWNAPNTIFVASRLRLKDMAVGSATVAYDIYNPRSSSGTSNFNADILWLKVTA